MPFAFPRCFIPVSTNIHSFALHSVYGPINNDMGDVRISDPVIMLPGLHHASSRGASPARTAADCLNDGAFEQFLRPVMSNPLDSTSG
ncbi:hypothetical protein LINPERPRIM_LOCUS28186 [Linum perenne]